MKADYRTAMAAGQDAGNRHAKRHNRPVWNEDDWNIAAQTTTELLLDSIAEPFTDEACRKAGIPLYWCERLGRGRRFCVYKPVPGSGGR